MKPDREFQAFLLGVEFGVREAERGQNLQAALDRAKKAWLLFAIHGAGEGSKRPHIE